jgi:WD40 repeat protein
MMKNDILKTVNGNNAAPGIYKNDREGDRFELSHSIRTDIGLNGVRSVNVTSDNRFLIITYEKSIPRICIVDLENLEFLPYKYSGHTDSVRMTRVTRDNKAFYTASWDGSSRRFEIESGKCDLILSGFGRSPSCFLEPEQELLFTASYDADCNLESKNSGRCWDLKSGKTISLYKHTNERLCPESIDIVYENGKVYTGSDDGCAFQWDLSGQRQLIKYFSINGCVRKLALSPNYFAAACTDGIVRVHFKHTGVFFRNFLHFDKDVREVRISKDEKKLWSATDGGTVSCFSLDKGEMIFCRKIHPLWIWSLCLMNNESILITGSGDGSVAFLSAESGQVLAQFYNLPGDNDFLITCPMDKVFPTGFFYTNNTDLIQVIMDDKEMQIQEILDLNDPGRIQYINKRNLKNLIITRLKNDRHYTALTENFMLLKKNLDHLNRQNIPQMLKA